MRKFAVILASILAVILALSMASALYNCAPSQTIMKLASVNNAHVETASSSQYSTRICYEEIFGVNYTGPSPQTCTGSNVVAKLAQSTNSHIEGPAGSLYPISICYADLACTLRSGACQLNEYRIVSLAQSTNSHASATNTFPLNICCSSAFALNATNPTNVTNGTGLMTLTINSPVNTVTYGPSIPLSITSSNTTALLYNYGFGNLSYAGPVNLNLGNGTYILNVYGLNATTMITAQVAFAVTNSSLPTNFTNPTVGTGLMTLVVNSPVAAVTYGQSIPLSVTANNASTVLYNYGTGNFSYSPTTLNLGNGSYILNVFALNATTMLQQSVPFDVTNSSLPTNSTNNLTGTGIMSYIINAPVSGTVYGGSVPINVTAYNATSIVYNLGSGNITYASPTTVQLANGSYVFTLYVSNSTTLFQASIAFDIVNSTIGGNGGNGGNGGGGSGGSGGSSSGGGVRNGVLSTTQRTPEDVTSNDEPIVLSAPEAPARKSISPAIFLQGMLILLILIAIIVILQLLINRHFQSKKRRE